MVIYLAPGDYHRMHSPADITFNSGIHCAGEMFPVAPSAAQYIPSAFTRNERLVLGGEWKHGSFYFVPVAAYNVGSITVTADPVCILFSPFPLYCLCSFL